MQVLIVEDDKHLLKTIVTILNEEGYRAEGVATGDDGCYLAENGAYDLLVLDIMLPGMDGLDIVRHIRSKGASTPILLLTAKDSVDDLVKGLDTGADDYLTKPFELRELLARVRALLRRQGAVGTEGDVHYKRIALRPKMREIHVDGQPLELSQKEYELFEYLLLNREQILHRDQISARVWGIEAENSANIVDVYIFYLRKKLKAYGCDSMIQTVRNVGYMLKEND